MNAKIKLTRIAVLVLLATLPVIFPLGGRDEYLFPYIPSFIDTTDGTFAPWVLIFAFIWITILWFVYGYLSGHWFGKSKKVFIICNIPVLVNAALEVVYYTVMGLGSADHPVIAYWIGSHIDKMNTIPFFGFGEGGILITILISVLYYFFLFWIGRQVGLPEKNKRET